MKAIICPECKSERLYHYTDAYVLRSPVIKDDGGLGLIEFDTDEYARFFECRDCGHKPTEAELLSAIDKDTSKPSPPQPNPLQ
jgi:DNA-directed RNA polymerase subunit RPC12/RpoP